MDEDEAKVMFTHGDTLVMIAALANAIISLNSAVGLVAEGKQMQATDFLLRSGEHVDEILKIMRDKLGEAVIPR